MSEKMLSLAHSIGECKNLGSGALPGKILELGLLKTNITLCWIIGKK